MNFNRVSALLMRQFYLMKSSPVRILPLFIWVAVDIVLWGFITIYLGTVTTSGINMVFTLLGAVLLWDFFVRVMHGVNMAFLEDVWARNFLNMFTTPMQISEYISGMTITSILTSFVGLAVMLGLAGLFNFSWFAYGFMLFPFLAILMLFGIALGIFSSGIMLRVGPASEWLIWPIPAFLSPFAGVFYPVSTLPEWMQAVSMILPPAYVFEGMRDIVAGKPMSMDDLMIGAGLVVVYVALACWYFHHVYKHAVKTGLIARYSAESIS